MIIVPSNVSAALDLPPNLIFRAATSSSSNTVTMPTHSAGDILVLFVSGTVNIGTTTSFNAPQAGGTVPVWNERRTSGTSLRSAVYYAVATANNHTSGTWTVGGTNANRLAVASFYLQQPSGLVYRLGGYAALTGDGTTTPKAPAVTMSKTDGTSALVHFSNATFNSSFSLAGYTARVGATATTPRLVTKDDTTSDGQISMGTTASTTWNCHTVEITTATQAAAVSFKTASGSVGTSVTMPTYSAGDILVAFASASGGGVPTTPPNWHNIVVGANGKAAYRIATGPGHLSGDWTGADRLTIAVLSGQSQTSPIGGAAVSNGDGSLTATAPAVTMSKTDGSSVLLHWAGDASPALAGFQSVSLVPTPSGYTNRFGSMAGGAEQLQIRLITKDDTTSDGAVAVAVAEPDYGSPPNCAITVEIKT